ncbi:MAG: phosphoribosylformylglycinamidine cyclo-ligase, partial [Clostridia bacterium]|nr:phosphoribosylformylglycinamidine cyclo-ligase [Clostridia bacterium]
KAVSHITGGGFYENIPRSIPEGFCARIDKSAVRVLPIFKLLQERGGISEHDMFNTYNMGVGMTAVVSSADVEKALSVLHSFGEDAYVLGKIVKGSEKIILE